MPLNRRERSTFNPQRSTFNGTTINLPTINRFMGSVQFHWNCIMPMNPGSAGIPAGTRIASRKTHAGRDAGAPGGGRFMGRGRFGLGRAFGGLAEVVVIVFGEGQSRGLASWN
jgi:hypothetical protein